MPSWSELSQFLVSGLALGGVYALSGVGLVVLYRATGVLYLAFGAVGALGALTAWSLGQAGAPGWVTWVVCVAVAAAVTLGYGIVFGPALAKRDPLTDAALGQRRLLRRADPGELDPGHRAGRRGRAHRGDRAVPALHQARHGHARHGQRPRDHRHPRRPGPQGRGGGLARLRGARGHRRPAARRPSRAGRHHAHLL